VIVTVQYALIVIVTVQYALIVIVTVQYALIVIVTVQYALIVIVTVQYAVIYSYLILSSYKLQFSIFVLKYLIIYNFQLIRYANFSFLLVPRYVLYYSKLYLYLFHCHHLEDIVKMYE